MELQKVLQNSFNFTKKKKKRINQDTDFDDFKA